VKFDLNVAPRARSRSRLVVRASQAAASPEQGVNYGPLPTLVGHHVRKAHSYLFQTFTEALAEVGLAPTQYNALMLIGLNPGLSQMALAEVAGIERTTIVPITNRFARAGWIRRTRRPEDRRLYSLRLTPQGEAVLAKARPLVEAHEKQFVRGLSASERTLLRVLLARIADIETVEPQASTSRQSAAHTMSPRGSRSNRRPRGQR
jgi:DNA-binding MarR family transcriptional regulator